MTSIAMGPVVSSTASVKSLLAPAHHRWLEQVRGFLDPAATGIAGFWDRWSATRYLGDQFLAHFRLERGLLSSIARLLDEVAATRLSAQAAHIDKVRARIDRVGRQRGTATPVAEDVRKLVDDLSTWCAELEAAVTDLRRGEMSSQANALLDRVVASASLAAL